MPDVLPFAAPQSSGSADLNPLLQQLLQRINGGGSTLQSNVVPIRQKQQEIQSQIADIQPAPAPEITPVPTQAPLASVTDPLKAMGSPMMLMALLGGALTGAPITSALQNATGFLEGIHKGDAEATKNHLDEFHANIDAAMKSNSAALEKYRAAMESKNFDLNKKLGEFRAVATEYGDPITMHAIETGDLEAAIKIIDARERNQQALQSHLDMLILRIGAARGPTVEFTLKDGSKVEGSRNKITGAVENLDGTPLDPSTIVREDRLGLPARSAPALALQRYIQDHPNATEDDITRFSAQYAQQVKAARDFGTGPLGNQTRSFSVGLYHLDTLQKLADALKNHDVKGFNTLANEWSTQTGQPAPSNFETAKQIIGAEVVKAIVGAGGGGVQERLEAANHISASLSPEQIAGAIDTTKELMIGQLKGLKSQYERTTKQSDFEEQFLSPEARDLFDKAGVKKYSLGQIIDVAGKHYRVIGHADSNDPDVEAVP